MLVTRLTGGEQRNRKRMAQVAAIYTVSRFVREPVDVLADLKRVRDTSSRPKRPEVRNKRVWASVEQEPKDVIDEAFRDARARDPKHKRQWVVLVDGNKDQLASIEAKSKELGPVRIVVDLIHVLECLWQAAHALYEDGNGTVVEAWVQERLHSLLNGGQAGRVGGHVRALAHKAQLSGRRLKAVLDSTAQRPSFDSEPSEPMMTSTPIGTFISPRSCGDIIPRTICTHMQHTCNATRPSPWVCRLPRVSLKVPVGISSKTEWTAAARDGHTERYAQSAPPNPLRPLQSVK